MEYKTSPHKINEDLANCEVVSVNSSYNLKSTFYMQKEGRKSSTGRDSADLLSSNNRGGKKMNL